MDRRQMRVSGFTLLELLMVVIIIGILASIALPQFIRAAERARTGEALTLMSSIRTAEGRYRAADPNGSYTTDLCLMDIGFDASQLPCPGGVTLTTTNWAISTDLVNIVAQRLGGGPTGGDSIYMKLDSGATCADAGAGTTPTFQIWGLNPPGC